MQSTIQLYNTALARLGGDQIEYEQSPYEQGASEGNAIVILCNNLFPHVLDLALSAHEWSFALRREELAERLDEQPVGGELPLRYKLPAGCVRPVRLEGNGLYVIEGDDLMTAVSPAFLVYVQRIIDPVRWPAHFADALAWGLAAEIATAQINDPNRQHACLNKYEYALQEAIAHDRNMQNPVRAKSSWLAARGNVDVGRL